MNLDRKCWPCLALSLFTACSPKPDGPGASSDAAPVAASASTATSPWAGAWTSTDAWDPEAQEAARFAVQSFSVQSQRRILFKEVTQARQQVVAGLNWDLHLQLDVDGAKRIARVTVWRHPDGRYSLSEWVWLD